MDTEQVIFCKDCKYFDTSDSWPSLAKCHHPDSKWESEPNLITGKVTSGFEYADHNRKRYNKCGRYGKWFKPIPPKKPWLDRVIAFFK